MYSTFIPGFRISTCEWSPVFFKEVPPVRCPEWYAHATCWIGQSKWKQKIIKLYNYNNQKLTNITCSMAHHSSYLCTMPYYVFHFNSLTGDSHLVGSHRPFCHPHCHPCLSYPCSLKLKAYHLWLISLTKVEELKLQIKTKRNTVNVMAHIGSPHSSYFIIYHLFGILCYILFCIFIMYSTLIP